MDHGDKEKASPDSQFADWMKLATDFWQSAAQAWPAGVLDFPKNLESSSAPLPGWMQEAWQALLKNWQISTAALGSPETLESLFKGASMMPQAAMRIVRTTWDGYFQLHQMWLKSAGKAGEATKAYSYEGLEPDAFKDWREYYEKELQPLLRVPQVGLMRLYQERANEAIDKFNQLQTALAEFMRMLNLPVEKSLRVMQEKLEEQAKEGKLSENFKDYYNMWIKILEGHFMTLYQSPEWVRVLGKTAQAADENKAARDNVLMDILQVLPVPTNRDMIEVYKELYTLKKTVKELTKKAKQSESTT